jgi:hypothetical protein
LSKKIGLEGGFSYVDVDILSTSTNQNEPGTVSAWFSKNSEEEKYVRSSLPKPQETPKIKEIDKLKQV